MTKPRSIQDVADEVARDLRKHIEENTAEDDERREAERDKRVAEAIRQLAEQGKLPPDGRKAGGNGGS